MYLVKLGKKGQVSIPQAVLRELALFPNTRLTVATTPDGAIVLRQLEEDMIEMYSDERLAEFERENEMTPEQVARYGPLLADFSGWLRAQPKQERTAARHTQRKWRGGRSERPSFRPIRP